jgi:hypothetical protein
MNISTLKLYFWREIRGLLNASVMRCCIKRFLRLEKKKKTGSPTQLLQAVDSLDSESIDNIVHSFIFVGIASIKNSYSITVSVDSLFPRLLHIT